MRSSFEDVAFVIVGDGEEKLIKELTAKVRDLGLEYALRFVGWRSDIDKIFADIDLLIVSAEQEAFGRTIIEAMAAGVPVVATKCGGPEEIIGDGTTGILVPVNDADQMAMAATRILSDNVLATRFAAAGRIRAHEMFGVNTYVANIESIINKLAYSDKPPAEAPDARTTKC